MPRPWRPVTELQHALQRGDLATAILCAHDLREDGKRIGLATALEFLPIVVRRKPDDYSRWALHWLARYATEGCQAIEVAAEVACLLEELPCEPRLIDRLRNRV